MAPPIKSMAKPTQSSGAAVLASDQNPPSNNLWIGNVSPEVSDSELKTLFEKHGKIDSMTLYTSRSYAFVYFRDIESAMAAKQGLQGYLLRGNALKIEFAKSAKPCKSLWVAGIGQSISKEELEKEFLRFGKLQEFRFLRDRNTAYVDYVTLEDAAQALKALNGKRIGGDQLRVDFLRSQSSKRELGPDAKNGQFPNRNVGPSNFLWTAQDPLKIYSEPSLVESKRQNQFLYIGSQKGDSQLSNILWIRYPSSVIIEEDMLHNAMILFGEIERIKTFADRNYALVEFRSVEEAKRAKEGLQGKLFNDPRISIEYSSGELGSESDYIADYSGAKGHLREFPFRPVQMDIMGLNHPVLVSNNSVHPPPVGIHGLDAYMRPLLGPHSNFEPALPGQEFSDSTAVHKLQNPTQTLRGGPNWRRSSPTPGIVSSPSAGFNLPKRSISGAWDVFDSSQLQRECKRSRSDAALPLEKTENQGGFDEQYGLGLVSSGGASGSLTRASTGGMGQRHAESDCIWRGIIAKGGTLVCHARCVPIGEGLGAEIPDVVNCSARTGLDLLSKHYDDAIGFNIVFFLPDSEEDFAPYTEFLRYLGSKDRAGVAKFDDGTTLFLVPPSDFLTKVLKVSGPERLYGVVLKFPQLIPRSTTMNPQSMQPQYLDSHKSTSLQPEFSAIPQMERPQAIDYARVLPQDSKLPPKPPGPLISSNSFTSPSVPPTAIASQAGLALTPELIASLTSLLPANSSSGSQIVSLPHMTSALGPQLKVATGPNTDAMQWKQEHQTPDHNVQLVPQLGGHMHSQLQYVPPTHTPVSNMTGHFHQPVNSYSQMHERTINLPSESAGLSKSMTSATQLQSGRITVTPEINQPHQQGSSQDILRGQGTDAPRLYNSSVVHQPAYPMASSNQVHGNGVLQTQPYMPLASEVDLTQQSQHLQTGPYGAVQESADAEADKNERYRTTLLFAANLLSRIHQPSGNQPGQGAGSN